MHKHKLKLFTRKLKIIVVKCICAPRNPAFTSKTSFSVNALIASRCIKSTSRILNYTAREKGLSCDYIAWYFKVQVLVSDLAVTPSICFLCQNKQFTVPVLVIHSLEDVPCFSAGCTLIIKCPLHIWISAWTYQQMQGLWFFFFFNFLFNLVVLSLSVLILLCSSSRANTVCDCAATELPHPIPFLLPDQDLRQLRYSRVESSIDYSVVLAKSQ